METNVIYMKNVSVKYGDNVVLENINLEIRKREIISIVGPNGGGKTTLLNVIMGFKHIFQGEIRVLGVSPKSIQRTGMIGYLPQVNSFDRNFPVKVFDVVAMARYAKKSILERLTPRDKELIFNGLEKVEMASFVNHHFGSLSGGQKQRVLIARALAVEPKLLILDEPSTGLDAVAQENFYQLLTRLRDEQDLTIIMVSHDIGSVSMFVDKVACLKRKIHFHGKFDNCMATDVLEKVFGKNIQFSSKGKQ